MRCAMCGNEAVNGQQFCSVHLGGRSGVAPGASGAFIDPYASFWQRVAGAIIDNIIFVLAGALISALAAAASSPMLIPLAWLLVYIGYYAGFESSSLQATPGKLAMDIKVTTLQGERIGFGRALGRLLGKLLNSLILGLGYLMPLFTEYRQGLHDKVAGTLVVRKRLDAEEIAEAGPAPRTSGGTIAAVIILVVFGGIFMVGILAAISIPAYQDYTIRSQVTEGLNASLPYRAAIEQANAEGKALTEISTDTLSVPTQSLRYVSNVTVAGGQIKIVYGGQAHRAISDKTLLIVPAAHPDGRITWVCGYHSPPPDAMVTAVGAGQETTILTKYLPTLCRR